MGRLILAGSRGIDYYYQPSTAGDTLPGTEYVFFYNNYYSHRTHDFLLVGDILLEVTNC
jgi:hypothetical protein